MIPDSLIEYGHGMSVITSMVVGAYGLVLGFLFKTIKEVEEGGVEERAGVRSSLLKYQGKVDSCLDDHGQEITVVKERESFLTENLGRIERRLDSMDEKLGVVAEGVAALKTD